MKTRHWSILVLAAALTGCDLVGLGADDCELIALPGIRMDLTEVTTGDTIISDQVEVVAREESYADTVRSSRSSNLQLAYERAGIYDVEVSAAGYVPWDTSGVVVTQGRCHVQTVEVTAELTPET